MNFAINMRQGASPSPELINIYSSHLQMQINIIYTLHAVYKLDP